jgi:hypothetical protein
MLGDNSKVWILAVENFGFAKAHDFRKSNVTGAAEPLFSHAVWSAIEPPPESRASFPYKQRNGSRHCFRHSFQTIKGFTWLQQMQQWQAGMLHAVQLPVLGPPQPTCAPLEVQPPHLE